VFFTKKKKRTVENESWFYHIFRKNSVLVHAKTTTSYDTVENALSILLLHTLLETHVLDTWHMNAAAWCYYTGPRHG
jgi:hypothetical protein